jgi:pimeloyl-ACP methyl ester carboxylesterase
VSAPTAPAGRFAPLPPRRTRTVTSADGAGLHVEEHGPAGGPAVVLVHGWTCSTVFWAAVTRALVATGHRVIAYDLRGHGRSPAGELGGYGTSALADDLAAVLDATLADGERAVVGGHSMGAMTILAAAGSPRLHARAAAVMLASTGSARLLNEARVVAFGPARFRTRVQRLLLGTRAPFGPVTALSRRLVRYVTMSPAATREQVEVCARIVHACPPRVRARWGRVLSTLDLEDQAAHLTVPTAVVCGGADRLTPAGHSRRLARALPHCTGLTELEGRGHMTPVEDPDAVAAVLSGLVTDHLAPRRRPQRAADAAHTEEERA